MNNFLELLMTVLTFIAVIYSSFAAFKVDYYNPIVKIFVSLIMPFSKLLFFLNPFLVGLIAGMIFSFFGLYISAGPAYEISYIIGSSFFNVLIIFFKVLFYFVIGGVIKSWVAPFTDHPLGQIVEDVSSGILKPFRAITPSFGGLDFSPIFAFIILNMINGMLIGIANAVL